MGSKTVKLDGLGEEYKGQWVLLPKLKVKHLKKLMRLDTKSPEGIDALSDFISDWNLSEDGLPLPKPKDGGIDELDLEVLGFIVDAIGEMATSLQDSAAGPGGKGN